MKPSHQQWLKQLPVLFEIPAPDPQRLLRRIRQLDVRRLSAFVLIVKIRDDRIACESLERQRRDEPLRVRRHHHAHIALRLRQQRCQIRRLVRGD